MELFTRAGPLVYPVLALAGAWVLYTLVHGAAALGRRRFPAPLYWVFPSLVLAAGGVGALLGQGDVETVLGMADPRSVPVMRLQGYREALRENAIDTL